MTRIVRCDARPSRPGRYRRIPVALTALTLAVLVPTLAACTSAATPAAQGSTSVATLTPRTTAVPVPSGGTIDESVAPQSGGAVTKVALTKPAVLPSKVTIAIASAKRKTVKANTPGEIAGPAVVVTVRITNSTSRSIDLGSTVVTMLDATGAPGQATTADAADPFTGTVAAGKSLTGVYVFDVPASLPNPIRISVSYAGGAPVALFAGAVS